MLEFCNMGLMANNMPIQWSLSNIIPIPKPGNLSAPDNYRGISLTYTMAKDYYRYNQNGFREKRSNVAQISAVLSRK